MDRVTQIQQQWARERPDLDVGPLGVIGRLHRLAAHLSEQLLTVYREHGLGEGEFDVLATLRRTGPPYALAPSALAEHTMVTTGAISKRLDRLERDGLVRRSKDDLDGRGRLVHLTESGVGVIDAAFTDHVANEARLLADITPEQAAQLQNLLMAWLTRVEPRA